MNVENVILILIVVVVALKFMPVKGVENITAAELKEKMKARKGQWIDVRTPGEFNHFHIHGFKNIPLNQLSAGAGRLSKDEEVIVICQSGMRSKKAAKLLKKKGFKRITNVKGGVSAWR